MTQFPNDDIGTKDLVSRRDIILESDSDLDGAGDLIFKTGGVERARVTAAGVGSGFGNLLGGSRAFVGTTDAATLVSAGSEYVWFQTDGAGNLLDIWTGVA